MLRQANDQFEKGLKEKQELEDYLKQNSEETVKQVWTIQSTKKDVYS